MNKFEIIESKRWLHSAGMTASIYGAVPWTSEADRQNWSMQVVGYTLLNTKAGTVGIGRQPFKTYEEAAEFVAQFN
jgi:hypothetical protein